MANENQFLISALLMGIFITFVYDILRILRRVIPHGNFLVSLEDICFWAYCAVEVFLLMYHESDGTLRWFAVLGALLGMLTYKKAVSPFFVKYSAMLLQKLLKIVVIIGSFLLRPLKILAGFAGKMGNRGKRAGKSAGRLLKKKLTLMLKVFKMTL